MLHRHLPVSSLSNAVYNISSSVLIKEEDKRSGSGNNPLAAIQDLGMFSMTNNFDNEVEILKSRTLIKKS